MNKDTSSRMHAQKASVLTNASMGVCSKILSVMYTGAITEPGLMQIYI